MRWLFAGPGRSDPGRGRSRGDRVLHEDRSRQDGQRPGRTRPRRAPSPTPKVSEFTDPCGTFETEQKAPVRRHRLLDHSRPSDPCTWRRQLQADPQRRRRHRHPDRLRPAVPPRRRRGPRPGPRTGELDPRYKPCVEDGLSCHDAAERDLKKANPDNRIGRTYVYRTDESFGPDLFRCPQMETHDRRRASAVYFRHRSRPTDGSDDASCDFTQGPGYDLILDRRRAPGQPHQAARPRRPVRHAGLPRAAAGPARPEDADQGRPEGTSARSPR